MTDWALIRDGDIADAIDHLADMLLPPDRPVPKMTTCVHVEVGLRDLANRLRTQRPAAPASASRRVEWRLDFTVDRTAPGWDQPWFRGEEPIIYTWGDRPVLHYMFFDGEGKALMVADMAEERGAHEVKLWRSTVTSTAWEQVDLSSDEAECADD